MSPTSVNVTETQTCSAASAAWWLLFRDTVHGTDILNSVCAIYLGVCPLTKLQACLL